MISITVGGMTYTRHVVDGVVKWMYESPNWANGGVYRLWTLSQVTLVDALDIIAALSADRSTTAVH